MEIDWLIPFCFIFFLNNPETLKKVIFGEYNGKIRFKFLFFVCLSKKNVLFFKSFFILFNMILLFFLYLNKKVRININREDG